MQRTVSDWSDGAGDPASRQRHVRHPIRRPGQLPSVHARGEQVSIFAGWPCEAYI